MNLPINIKYIVFVLLTNNVFTTTGMIQNPSTIQYSSLNSSGMIQINNTTINNKYHKLCFNDMLFSYMKDLYSNFDFTYDEITSLIKNMTKNHISGQNFFINYNSIDKIFDSQEKAILFFRIADHLKENIAKELDFVKETAPEKIKSFLRSYLIKISNNFPALISYILNGDQNLDLPLNEMFSCKSCPSMFSQLYFILVLDRISKKLINPIKFDGLNNSELTFILFKDIILLFNVFKDMKIKMNNEELTDEFNLMLEKKFKLFSEYSSVMFALHWVNYPYTWSKRMNRHFEYESRLLTLQRFFRTRVEFFGSKDLEKARHLLSSNLLIDTLNKTVDVNQNEMILNDIGNIETSYFNNKTEFITTNNAEIIQTTNTRISFKRTYDNKKYTLNMIFFDRESKINNDIFLYDIRSEYILNTYKVFNYIASRTDYDGKIEILTIWTLTDEYDSRLNINMIKDIHDITNIAMDILKGLRDLEIQSIFYPDIGFGDIVVCNVNTMRIYKIDLRRAFRLDRCEIRRFGKNIDHYHNDTIQGFMMFFKQMTDHLNISINFFNEFVELLKKQTRPEKYSLFDYISKRH